MFWIALELKNPKMGLIMKLSLKIKTLTAFKCNGATKFGNIAVKPTAFSKPIKTQPNQHSQPIKGHYKPTVFSRLRQVLSCEQHKHQKQSYFHQQPNYDASLVNKPPASRSTLIHTPPCLYAGLAPLYCTRYCILATRAQPWCVD